MTILFEPLTATDTAGNGRARALFDARGRGFDLAAGEGAGRARIVFGGRGRGDAEYSVEDPIIPAHGRGSVFFGATGIGAETVDVDGAGIGAVSFRGHGYGLDIVPGDTPAAGRGHVAFVAKGRGADEGLAYGFAVERPAIVGGYGGMQFVTMTDQLALGGHIDGTPIAVLRAALDLVAGASTRVEGVMTLRAGIKFETRMAFVFRELLELGLTLGAASAESYSAIEQMVDALLLGDVVATEAEAFTLIADAIVFGTMLDSRLTNTMTDSVAFSASVTDAMVAVEKMLDALLLTESVTATATLAVLMEDSLALFDAMPTTLEAHTVLRDRLNFMLRLNIDNAEFIAFTLNPDTKGTTRYAQWPFNSYARIGNTQFGMDDTGGFRMEGDTDAGEPIAARIRLGLSSMGSQLVKRIAAAYFGYSATGDLFVKVVTASTTDGEREANVYRLVPRAADTTREGRTPFGKGLKSVYYDFVIENVDGADFAIDTIEFFPLVTQRRIRGDSSGKR